MQYFNAKQTFLVYAWYRLWDIFIFGLQYSRLFLILNSFDFLLLLEESFRRKI